MMIVHFLIYRINNSSGLLDFTLASVEGNISGGIGGGAGAFLAASANSSIQPQVVLADK